MASSRSFAPKEFRGANDNDIIEAPLDLDKILIEAFIRKRAKAKAKTEDTKAKKIIAK